MSKCTHAVQTHVVQESATLSSRSAVKPLLGEALEAESGAGSLSFSGTALDLESHISFFPFIHLPSILSVLTFPIQSASSPLQRCRFPPKARCPVLLRVCLMLGVLFLWVASGSVWEGLGRGIERYGKPTWSVKASAGWPSYMLPVWNWWQE